MNSNACQKHATNKGITSTYVCAATDDRCRYAMEANRCTASRMRTTHGLHEGRPSPSRLE